MRAYRVPAQRDEIARALAELKARQCGVFERDQARALGLSDDWLYREVASGNLLRPHARVYRDPAVPPTWEQDLFAALLWAGSGAAVSHRSAAALWKLDGCEEGSIEIKLPKSRQRPRGIITHRSKLGPGEVTQIRGLRVTSPTRTIFDLAGVVDEETLEIALDSALRRGLTSTDYLSRKFENRRRKGCRGSAVLGRLLTARSSVTAVESALETRFLRLVRQAKLPTPQSRYEVDRYRLDFAYPQVRLGIELEGYAFHSGRRAWARDLRRSNDLLRLGWTLLHFTWEDVTKHGDRVVDELRTHLLPNLLS